VPLLIGAFWLLPYYGYGPAWSPFATQQLLERLPYAPTLASLDELKGIEHWFPLDANLHQQIGVRELVVARQSGQAWKEFRVADRLAPAQWTLPTLQGWLSRQISPGMSFHFWSVAVERAGRRAPDIFTAAYHDCIDLQGGEEFWHGYAEGHPEFLLTYAQLTANEEESKAAYDEWWKARGVSTAGLEKWEITDFYFLVQRWGNAAQLEIWMNRRPELEPNDYRTWATILHDWQLDADAWTILSRRVKEPAFPAAAVGESSEAIEVNWREHPEDPLNAQAYARACWQNGEKAKSEQVILSVATGKSPPAWFIEKAAFLYAARKDYATAVTSLLRLGEPSPESTAENGTGA
jgi:hypothetical protein